MRVRALGSRAWYATSRVERVPEVDELPLPVAQPASAEADDGLVVGGARELHERRSSASGPAGDREPVDHRVLLARELLHAVREELLERRGERVEPARAVPLRALAPHQDRAHLAFGLDLADLERPSLEQRIHHLQEEERVAADAGHEIRAHRAHALVHAEARLDAGASAPRRERLAARSARCPRAATRRGRPGA